MLPAVFHGDGVEGELEGVILVPLHVGEVVRESTNGEKSAR